MNDLRTIIVSGSRDGAPWGEVETGMDWALTPVMTPSECIPSFNHVVVGSKRGVDGRVFAWALERELIATVVPALWKSGGRGRAEGPIRNERMPVLFPPLAWLAFPGGPGTGHAVSVAKRLQIPVWRWLGRADGWRREL